MLWLNIKRVSRSGFVNFWRNGLVSAASVLMMIITLMMIGSLLLASAYFDSSLEAIKAKVDISVSFKADAAENDILSMKNVLAALPGVREVIYTSREQELANFKERHRDNALLLQSLNEVGNPFGARLDIQATNPDQYESIARFLDASSVDGSAAVNRDAIDQVTFKKDIIDQLIRVIAVSTKVGFAVSMLLLFISILVVFNTVALAIYSAREEIAVMRLVGASNSYITGPFLVEGMIVGVISAFVAVGLLYPLTIWVKTTSQTIFGGINLVSYYLSNFAQLFSLLLLAGAGLGVLASFLAIRRYLKV